MNKEQFKDLIFSLPLKNFQDLGYIVDVTDIYNACRSRGIAINHPVKSWLEQLGNENIISLIYDEQSGSGDILIGVRPS